MKSAIVTLCIGKDCESLAEVTHPSIKAYADRIKADFIIINKSENSLSPHWEKFQIHDLLNKYDRILYLDTDLIVRDDCPNLFNIVPYTRIGAFNEARYVPREYSLVETCRAYGQDWEKLNWNGKYYNTGVLVLSKCHRKFFKKPDMQFSSYFEQGYLNMRFAQEESIRSREKRDPLMYDLHYKYNRMTCLDFSGEERHASYIIHYAGYKYTIDTESIKELIRRDIEKWKIDGPDYKYRRHILVIVSGGLGDQLDAEPAIRYMQKIYPDDDIYVTTHWPRLFKHLPYPACKHDDFVARFDTPYYKIWTFPDPTTINYAVVSNLMCHTVDYCSMAVLHRMLPLRDRVIKLAVEKEDDEELDRILDGFDLSKAVLVHPGRHWESKSFPRNWWQELINKLTVDAPVCLIGTDDSDNRGAYQLELPSNSINLIDRTTIGTLISAIARAPVLVSNDSAPVHIAGAFDNWIVLIPSCKHPDHVLPYRMNDRGEISNYHKAYALYKKLTLDDCDTRPTTWIDGGSSAEFLADSWENYLPTVDEVYTCVMNCYNRDKKILIKT